MKPEARYYHCHDSSLLHWLNCCILCDALIYLIYYKMRSLHTETQQKKHFLTISLFFSILTVSWQSLICYTSSP